MSHAKSNCSLVALTYWYPMIIAQTNRTNTLLMMLKKVETWQKYSSSTKCWHKSFFCPIWTIPNKCPVNICFSTRRTTWSMSLEWHLSLCHFLFETPSPMRHSWWVLFACTPYICLFSLFSKRICANEKAESLKITFFPTTEFISNF